MERFPNIQRAAVDEAAGMLESQILFKKIYDSEVGGSHAEHIRSEFLGAPEKDLIKQWLAIKDRDWRNLPRELMDLNELKSFAINLSAYQKEYPARSDQTEPAGTRGHLTGLLNNWLLGVVGYLQIKFSDLDFQLPGTDLVSGKRHSN